MTRVISFGGVGINTGNYKAELLQSYTIPPKEVTVIPRHGGFGKVAAINYAAGYQLPPLFILIADGVADVDAARRALFAALDTSTTSKALIISDDDGGNERYIMGVVRAVDQVPDARGEMFAATIIVDGVQHWQGVTATADEWDITASEETNAIVVGGDLDVYPTYAITPTDVKSTGTVYKRAYFFPWTAPIGYEQCPKRLTIDTEALIDASKISAATNIACYVDGKEVRRWIDTFDDAESHVWLNLDFGPGLYGALSGWNGTANTAMGSGDSVTDIVLSSDLTSWPQAGTVIIGSEAFVYTGINRAYKILTGVTRAAYETSAAVHAVGDTVYSIQHHVELVYGPNVAAATVFPDDTYQNGDIRAYDDRKPVIDLPNSRNDKWVWAVFGEDEETRLGQKPRPARWNGVTPRAESQRLFTGVHYSGEPTSESPYTHIGMEVLSDKVRTPPARWFVTLPYSLLSIDYEAYGFVDWSSTPQNGSTLWTAQIVTKDFGVETVHASLTAPDTIYDEFGTFRYDDDYDASVTPATAPRAGVQLNVTLTGVGLVSLAVSDLTVYFVSTGTLGAVAGAEASTYNLDAILENTTTGESITLQLPMAIDETLTIDTEAFTATYSQGDGNQYQAFRRNGVRLPILRLVPGTNTLQFTETGLAGVTLETTFKERYY